ncbi:MAG: aldo/keto reductase [Verrucomicrobiae bacterium]|nr:aldo/keto reductase [Verrucomicrobiae bacterium]
MKRREFLASLAAATAGAAALPSSLPGAPDAASPARDRLGALLPTRPLGKTGVQVTAFCLGGHHAELKRTPAETQAIIEAALEHGCRFFDNAKNYSDGEAERRYGQYLVPKYRDLVFIMTKSSATTAAEARKELDGSLQRMKCDYLDLWQIHHITSPEDVETRLKNGVLDVFLEAKRSGKTRFIGFTGHSNYQAHLRMLALLKERGLDLDTCQMPINLCDPHYESFITNVLPLLQQRQYGILAMKTMAYGTMVGQPGFGSQPYPNPLTRSGVTPRQMHEYVYSLPVSALVSGCTSPKEVAENTSWLREFKGLPEAERQRLLALSAKHAGQAIESYKSPPKKD